MTDDERMAFSGHRHVKVTGTLAAGLVVAKVDPGSPDVRVLGLDQSSAQFSLPGPFLGMPYTGPTLRPFKVPVMKLPRFPEEDSMVLCPVAPGSFDLLPVNRQLPGGFRKVHRQPSERRLVIDGANGPGKVAVPNGHAALVPVSAVEPAGLTDEQAAWLSEMRAEINSFVTRGLVDLVITGGHLEMRRVERQVVLKVGDLL